MTQEEYDYQEEEKSSMWQRVKSFKKPTMPDEEAIINGINKTHDILRGVLAFSFLITAILFCIYSGMWLLAAIAGAISSFFAAIGASGFGGLMRQ